MPLHLKSVSGHFNHVTAIKLVAFDRVLADIVVDFSNKTVQKGKEEPTLAAFLETTLHMLPHVFIVTNPQQSPSHQWIVPKVIPQFTQFTLQVTNRLNAEADPGVRSLRRFFSLKKHVVLVYPQDVHRPVFRFDPVSNFADNP